MWVGLLAVVGLAAVLILLALLADWRAQRSLRAMGEPRLLVEGGPYALGDAVCCRVTAALRSPLRLERAAFALVCTERVSWTKVELEQGEETRTAQRASEEVWVRDLEVSGARELRAEELLELWAEFELPLDGPPSFRAAHNSIDWSVTFRAVVSGGPDATLAAGIRVDPQRRRVRATAQG